MLDYYNHYTQSSGNNNTSYRTVKAGHYIRTLQSNSLTSVVLRIEKFIISQGVIDGIIRMMVSKLLHKHWNTEGIRPVMSIMIYWFTFQISYKKKKLFVTN